MLPNFQETICALATAQGTAGLGVIRVSGPAAFDVVDRISRLSHGRSCGFTRGHTLIRAKIVDSVGDPVDDVLLAIFHAPRSYTGDNVVEISAHGGPMPLRRIMECLLRSGARLAEPGEFTLRAFLNGKMDLAQAEAVGDSIAAQTEHSHRLALRQSAGQLSRAVSSVREILLGILARVEGSIDFPEDVGEMDRNDIRNDLQHASSAIQVLLETANQGILYREGLSLVLVGRANVGKSSLLNALLRAERAIVTAIPGTTRDTIEESINVKGIPVRAVDTAGLRETDDVVEQIGVVRSREQLAAADIVLAVMDAAEGLTEEDQHLLDEISTRPHLVVWNKWDIADEEVKTSMTETVTSNQARCVPFCALNSWNLDVLEQEIADLALQGVSMATDSQDPCVTHVRHRHALEKALTQVSNANVTLMSELPADFLAIDLQGALSALGEITGQTTPEEVIAEIFSRFCIGK